MNTLGPKTSPIEALETKLAHDRAELVERLVNGGHTPEQAENVAGACAAYGSLASALEVIRRR
jgi:hypothetical protein